MFLKRIEMNGFKSFADPSVIRFDQDVTGIVGPNGCGKSNVTDAVRWVLGEQSAKSLRTGAQMSDIIFAGSESRRPVNTAKVTLVFDNSEKIFDSPFEEIEITREIRRGSSETYCYINRTPCRLKDISELVMDTGLGRDSLSIITQGNISAFADARPEERRLLFEEAAGVVKYKKRKKSSLARLETVSANLERVQDLIEDLAGQIDSLKEQAEKAREYSRCRDELTQLEISLIASRLEKAKEQADALEYELKEKKLAQASKTRRAEELEEQLEDLRSSVRMLDGQIMTARTRQQAIMQELLQVQKQKTELDEKRKYALNASDRTEKIASLKAMCEDAQTEYQQRRERAAALEMDLNQAKSEQEILQQAISHQNQLLAELSEKISSSSQKILIAQNRLQSFAGSMGVQSVFRAKGRLQGILGLVSALLEPQSGYEQAISSALAGASDQIVTQDEAAARAAIAYLKKTHGGRATFLPLSVCKARSLQAWQKDALESCQGILGLASDFASNGEGLDALRERLLGNIVVTDNLVHANAAARKVKFSVKFVTLEGDVVHSGGAMSGGSARKGNSQTVLRHELEREEERLGSLQENQEQARRKKETLEEKARQQQETVVGLRIDLEKLKNIVQVKKEKFESLFLELRALDDQASLENSPADSLALRLSELHAGQDETERALRMASEQREHLEEQITASEKELRKLRKELNAISGQLHASELSKARLDTRMEQDLQRLSSEYSLTYEAACQKRTPIDEAKAGPRAALLRKQLAELGDVNLKAPEQYDQAKERHDFLASQKAELEAAAREILQAVDEMDETMKTQFMDMFNKINDNLDGIFQAMFGGGHASLSLSDPENILESGVEVNVQPPGKTVKSMQTFSGGEKALIAISILFAILKARTVPLCIFDEVEAALDQANVERFARYIARFKDSSQFIVVTHRPGTMEQCDALYGITMKKDGVSQVLKVLLKDAMEMSGQKG